MLKKERNDIDNEVWSELSGFYRPMGYEGWPPGLDEYIKDLIIKAVRTTIENIHTEKELEDKMNNILLDDEQTQQPEQNR